MLLLTLLPCYSLLLSVVFCTTFSENLGFRKRDSKLVHFGIFSMSWIFSYLCIVKQLRKLMGFKYLLSNSDGKITKFLCMCLKPQQDIYSLNCVIEMISAATSVDTLEPKI